MKITEVIKEVEISKEYDFLKTSPMLGNNVFLLALGGSYAYGTNVASSDIDVRGGACNTARDILLHKDFKTFHDSKTDTVIYSFEKLMSMLTACNPAVIELLGCKPEHYIRITNVGKTLLNKRGMFLSQKAIGSFGGYINSQLYQLRKMNRKDVWIIEIGNKLMMHAVRAYYMAFDILERGEIITYRENEHDLLMQLRSGKFSCSNGVLPEFDELINQLENRFTYAKNNTVLPELPKMEWIEDFIVLVNKEIVYPIKEV